MPSDRYYDSKRHRVWREKVLRRAGYLCQECLRYGMRTPATTAHHVMPREIYPEQQYILDNGQALCPACHNKAHPEKLRGNWD